MARVRINKGYMITLSKKDMEALAFIADRYEYGAALYNSLERVHEDSDEYWISESNAWNWQQAVQDEDGRFTLAGGSLREVLEELDAAIV